ncbi:phage minor capsid protein [Enterococcus faecium]|uniref:phage minor capsid protein n=1 Tax=Enterococcus faecium TaxID=1352 RepID=UPI002DBE85B2|nr:phage minor capsid protein [Enterococcus faecium]
MNDLIQEYKNDLKMLKKQHQKILNKRYRTPVKEHGRVIHKLIDDRSPQDIADQKVIAQAISTTEYALFWLETGREKPFDDEQAKKIPKHRRAVKLADIDVMSYQVYLQEVEKPAEETISPKKKEMLLQVTEIESLNSGHDNILDWQREKLQQLHLFNKETAKVISQITGIAESEIESMFDSSGEKIIRDLDKQLPYDPKTLPSNLDNVMKAYHDQVWSDINNYVNQTLLSTNFGYGTATAQMYTEIINKTTAAFNSGLFTFDEALERTIQGWAQKGIKSTFIDKGGHTWSLERYVRTVLKSTLSNTYDTLRKDRMSEYSVHTVLVTSHMGARQACSKIQGHVVDLRPMSELPPNWKYRSIYDPYWQAEYETAGGHRGVNCQHMHIPFIPSVNTNNQPKFNEKENKKVAELTKKQRYLERQIVKYKKNRMVSEALRQDENAKEWAKRIRAAQSRLRTLVDSNEYLSRNYVREKVYTPINTLLKDFHYDDF